MLYSQDKPISDTIPSSSRTDYTYEGKEIVLTRRPGRPWTFRTNPNFYSAEQKLDAATLYSVYGNPEEVSKLTDVPVKVIREWKEEPWWAEIQKKIFVEQNEKLSSKISNVLDKTIEHLADRLDNGDTTYNPKTGEITRKPIEARVLTSLFETLSHQRRVTRGEPTSITSKVGVDDRLKTLEAAFLRFANATQIEGEAIHAVESREVQKDSQFQYQRVPQGQDIPEDESQVWESKS